MGQPNFVLQRISLWELPVKPDVPVQGANDWHQGLTDWQTQLDVSDHCQLSPPQPKADFRQASAAWATQKSS